MVVASQVGATTLLAPYLEPRTVVAVWNDPSLLGMGLLFSLTALTILLAHELGHYLACRRYGLPATLPYFLPVPFNFGTLGAFIRIKAPIRTKTELFDVGIAGPIAGFVVLLPFLAYGVAQSHYARISGGGDIFKLGEPLLLRLFAHAFHGPPPAGTHLDLHPVAVGAWLGLFATALNLLPIGQLDGGHILYATVGRLQRRLALPLLAVLGAMGFLWQGWWVWCFLVLAIGPFHPPVYDESEPLDGKRKALALLALAMFALCVSPVPIDIVPLG